MTEQPEEQIADASFTFGEDSGGGEPRTGDWAGWEQARSRSFSLAGPLTIGDGKLGSVANLEMKLECRRTAAGFEGNWSFAMEERIGPWRVERGRTVGHLVDSANKPLVSFDMPQFGRACGTRRHQWQGTLTKEQFDSIRTFFTSNEVPVRRC